MIALMDRSNVTTLEPEEEGIGPLIQRLRLSLGISQETLADRLGMNRGYLSQIESSMSKWPAKYIAGFARELGIPPSVLGRAAGRIIRDADYDPIGPLQSGVKIGGSLNLTPEAPDRDPYLRIVFAEAPDLSPAGRRALAAQVRFLKETEAGYRAEAERDATPDRGED